MNRPAIYTSFDWRTDAMYFEDRGREELLRAQLAQKDEDDVGQKKKKRKRPARVVKKWYIEKLVSQDDFTDSMKNLSEAFCTLIYDRLKYIDSQQVLEGIKEEVDEAAWKCHNERIYPNDFASLKHLPEEPRESRQFLDNLAIVYFAVYQKYVLIKLNQLANE